MPQVPVYNEGVRQSVNAGSVFQSPAADVRAFGGGDAAALDAYGKAVTSVDDKLVDVVRQQQAETNATKADEAYLQLNQRMQPVLYGGKGVYTQEKGNALGAVGRAKDEFDKAYSEIEQGLDNEEQRATFRKKAGTYRVDTMTSVARHEATQRGKWREGVMAAGIETAANRAAENFTNPEMIGNAVVEVSESARSLARLQGLSPEEADNYVKNRESATLYGVAARRVQAEDFKGAREIMADPRMSPDHKLKLEQSLEQDERLVRAQRWSSDAVRRFGVEGEAAALAEARKSFQGRDLESVLTHTRAAFSDVQARKAKNESDAAEALWRQMEQAPDEATAMSIADRAPKMAQRESMRAWWENRGRKGRYDPDAEVKLMNGVDSGDFKNIGDLLQYKGAVRPEVFAEAQKAFNGQTKFDVAGLREVYRGFKGVKEMTPSNHAEFIDFRQKFAAFLADDRSTEPIEDKMDRFAKRYFAPSYVPGTGVLGFFKTSGSAGELAAAGKNAVMATPPEAKARVGEVAGLLGQPIKEDSALDTFYTREYIGAVRGLEKHNKPVTPANIAHVIKATRASKKGQ